MMSGDLREASICTPSTYPERTTSLLANHFNQRHQAASPISHSRSEKRVMMMMTMMGKKKRGCLYDAQQPSLLFPDASLTGTDISL